LEICSNGFSMLLYMLQSCDHTNHLGIHFLEIKKREDISKYVLLVHVYVKRSIYYPRCRRKSEEPRPEYGLTIPSIRIAIYGRTAVTLANVTNLPTFTRISLTVRSIPTTTWQSCSGRKVLSDAGLSNSE